MVVEGEGHAAFGAALLQGLPDGGGHLGLHRLFIALDGGGRLGELPSVHMVLSLIDLPAACEQVVRDLSAYCIFHLTDPPS